MSLRDLMYVHETLAEFVRFFHQPMHHPDIHAVQRFLGTRGSGDAIDILFESVYQRMHKLLPSDIHQAFVDGERFEHPLPPAHYASEDDRAE